MLGFCATAQGKEAVGHHTEPVLQDKKAHMLGITLTPGGFLAGEGVWRSRNEQTDISSTFSGIPLGNNPQAHMREFRLSARQSRVSLLAEGAINTRTLLSGYYEADFLGNGTANSNESNSYDLRMRNVYLTLDKTDWGFHLLAGQNWSLTTTSLAGIAPRQEVIPTTIDGQYAVGFVWKRQPQFRVTGNFGADFWAAVSVENPQTTFGGTACGVALPGGIIGQVCSAAGTQTLPSTNIFSLNHIPDVVAKLAYETKISKHKVHAEVFGLYRSLYDRVQTTNNLHNTNHDTTAGGVGAGLFVEVLPSLLDMQANFLSGHGIGSYASGSLPDATIGLNGRLVAIPETIYMMGATLHATPCLDLYVYGGQERQSRKYFQVGNSFFGYGVPNANNVGCSVENGTCAGNTNNLWQVTAGLWNKFYKGSYGDLRGGLQYSYTHRKLFSGTGGQTGVSVPKAVGYNTNDNMVFFSMRYYPFT